MKKNINDLIFDCIDIVEEREEYKRELTKIDEKNEKINSITKKTFIAGSLLLVPSLLYFISILPKSIPLSLIMGSAFLGAHAAVISGTIYIGSNLLYFLPLKKLFKGYINQLDDEKKALDRIIKKEKNNDINKDNKKIIKPKYSYNKSNNNPEIIIKNGMPCYKEDNTKVKRLSKK